MNKKYKRVQLDMAEETFSFLNDLKNKTNSASRAEVIKNAIFFYDYLVEQVKQNKEIIIRNGTGKEEKLVIPLFQFTKII